MRAQSLSTRHSCTLFVKRVMGRSIKPMRVQVTANGANDGASKPSQQQPAASGHRVTIAEALKHCDMVYNALANSMGTTSPPFIGMAVSADELRHIAEQKVLTEVMAPLQKWFSTEWLPLFIAEGTRCDSKCAHIMHAPTKTGRFKFDLQVKARFQKMHEWTATHILLTSQAASIDKKCDEFVHDVAKLYFRVWDLASNVINTGHGKHVQKNFVDHNSCKRLCINIGRALLEWRLYAHAANLYWRAKKRDVPMAWLSDW